MKVMLAVPKPHISECVLGHIQDAIEQANQLGNVRAGEGLTMALDLIERRTDYTREDFEGYADIAIAITRN